VTDRKFALRFIAILVMGAACCAALVGLAIYLTVWYTNA
jgi:hypothetical protein